MFSSSLYLLWFHHLYVQFVWWKQIITLASNSEFCDWNNGQRKPIYWLVWWGHVKIMSISCCLATACRGKAIRCASLTLIQSMYSTNTSNRSSNNTFFSRYIYLLQSVRAVAAQGSPAAATLHTQRLTGTTLSFSSLRNHNLPFSSLQHPSPA